MSCPCNILISYTFQADPGATIFEYNNLDVAENSIVNGKSEYTWTDDNFIYSIYWDGSEWKAAITNFGTVVIASFAEDLDCPGTNLISAWTSLSGSYTGFTVEAVCQIVEVPKEDEDTEAVDCFNIIVWDLQCKYAQCVLKYFTNLKFGIDNKIDFENLLKKKKALEILLCYDARDIVANTTIYNNITYSEIKQLMNKF